MCGLIPRLGYLKQILKYKQLTEDCLKESITMAIYNIYICKMVHNHGDTGIKCLPNMNKFYDWLFDTKTISVLLKDDFHSLLSSILIINQSLII
jgi:hypothetical protein